MNESEADVQNDVQNCHNHCPCLDNVQVNAGQQHELFGCGISLIRLCLYTAISHFTCKLLKNRCGALAKCVI